MKSLPVIHPCHFSGETSASEDPNCVFIPRQPLSSGEQIDLAALVVLTDKNMFKKGAEPILGFVVLLGILFPNQTKNQSVSSISRELNDFFFGPNIQQNSHLRRVLFETCSSHVPHGPWKTHVNLTY